MALPDKQRCTDGYWWSNDGLRLHYRDYAGRADRPAILCLHGLTRNARDWDEVAGRLAGEWRLIVPEMRGRGESGYARDPMTYVPLVYLQDVEALLNQLDLPRVVAFGTSLGGILTMLLAATDRDRIAAALLNDVGPELDPVGLGRIRGYVGKQVSHPTWMHAARCMAEGNAAVYPGYDVHDWLHMAKRLHRLTSAGRIQLDYDMRIAEPFRVPGNEAGPDMWRAYEALAGKPVAIVRGALSDILPARVAEAMAARIDGAELTVVPDTGHAPTLNEAPAQAAIDRLLARVAGA
ncbi:alpha/beta hydrolase [Sphingomonas sp. Leaf407]|uniref:alpha/beta fold hydrolase n=1 Tax=unclassified Sphingomonas TaxID=196159 RepID=UPI0006FB310E|nr:MULTISPECIES: alpha/beta hydrolase [unclassified Sphingomonas]KQN37765.1 alpha/beta hydrolase [Sphingomonas sp. Leaf42]KQT28132.1 alpha/beta hydrolase [Sphingomonas sp. Leaf407]